MKKFLQQIGVFITILVIILILKSILIVPNISNEIYIEKINDYSTSNENYNTLFFGSSRIFRHVIPTYFDSLNTNYASYSYNLGIPATFNPELYYLYTNFLETDSRVANRTVKNVFIELQSLNNTSLNNSLTKRGSYWCNSDYYLYTIKYIYQHERGIRGKVKNSLRYTVCFLNNFATVYPKIDADTNYTKSLKDGYLSLGDDFNIYQNPDLDKRRRDLLENYDELATRSSYANTEALTEFRSGKKINALVQKIDAMLDLSQESGISLYFIIPPRQETSTYRELMPLVDIYPNNIINLADSEKYSEFYDKDYSFDIGHLNDLGARIFTEYIFQEYNYLTTYDL